MLTDEGYFLLITEPSTIDVLIGQKVSIFNFQRTPISLGGVHWPLVEATLPALWCGSLNCTIENQITVHTTSPILIYLANV